MIGALSAILFMAAAGATQEITPMDAVFEAFSIRYLDEAPSFSPVNATQLGDHRFDHMLDEVDFVAREKEVAFINECLDALGKIDRAQLSRANQVDYELLRHDLEGRKWFVEVFQEWAWNPLRYTGLCGNALYSLLVRGFAPLDERLVAATARLEQFPRLLEQVRQTLEPARVPRIHAETAVKQHRGVLSIIDDQLLPQADVLSDSQRTRLSRAIATAREAIEAHQEWLESSLLPNAAGNCRIGSELFEQKLSFSLHTPLSRAAIKQRAEQQMHDVRARMYEYAKEALVAREGGRILPDQHDDEQMSGYYP